MPNEVQCGLCCKVCLAHAVRIAKCNHIYCMLCILDYLKKRRFCPICVPKKERGFLNKYIVSYLNPIRLIKKIKKQHKKINKKHLIPIVGRSTDPVHNANQAVEFGHMNENSTNGQLTTTVDIENEPYQRSAYGSLDLNNNLAEQSRFTERHDKIGELITKNENLQQFLVKTGTLDHKIFLIHKLSEFNRVIANLSQHQQELRQTANRLKREVDNLKELNLNREQLMKTKRQQELILERANSINRGLNFLISDYRQQNLELKQNYLKLVKNTGEILNLFD